MRFAALLGLGLLISSNARADEQMQPLAVSGQWAAFSHTPSMTAPPDVCAVINPSAGVAFRYGDQGLELRVSNDKWSLPSDVSGKINLWLASFNKDFQIADNTSTMVGAPVAGTDAAALFAAMDKAPNMIVTIGNAKPFSVSLVGSTKATNAFRTCAHLGGNTGDSGSNPFK